MSLIHAHPSNSLSLSPSLLSHNHRAIGDAGILTTNSAARKEQEELGMPFLYALQAVDFLQTGLLCKTDAIITMPVTQSLRLLTLSSASGGHLLDKMMQLGMGNVSQRLASKKDVVAILVQELQSIVKTDDISPSAQLLALGLDSFGFVSIQWLVGRHSLMLRTDRHDRT